MVRHASEKAYDEVLDEAASDDGVDMKSARFAARQMMLRWQMEEL